jgi:hypothetical protein
MYAMLPAAPFVAGAGALILAQALVWVTFRPVARREAGTSPGGGDAA